MFEPDSDISLPEELQTSELLLYVKPGACGSLKISIKIQQIMILFFQ